MKLTKADIDKVRNIEGFPIARDEDIIALSRPPYYTACPNPFIEDFIREHGTPYDEATDDYHREPFAADVSENKYEPVYKLHSYPTKVPPQAIRRYIEHYTSPGDIVFDGFCGTGMTGVAAQSCEQRRFCVMSDISPTATYIAGTYNGIKKIECISSAFERIIAECKRDLGWIYDTEIADENAFGFLSGKGKINYTVWSKVVCCPSCSKEVIVWNRSIVYDFDKAIGKAVDKPTCLYCGAELKFADCDPIIETKVIDGKTVETQKFVPVLINYNIGKNRFEKEPSEQDIMLLRSIDEQVISTWYPKNLMLGKGERWGDSYRAGYHKGITRVDDFFTKRSLLIYSYLWEKIMECDSDIQNDLRFVCTACFNRTTKMVRYMAQHKEKNVGPLSGTLYLSPIFGEINVIDNVCDRFEKWKKAYSTVPQIVQGPNTTCTTTQSTTDISLPPNSIDYIFVDPPFGDNLMYSELNFITDSWIKVCENIDKEAIVNTSQSKGPEEYKTLMQESFAKMYQALKPNRWITVEFHNSKNLIWNLIQEAIIAAGFVIADVRTLDKKKGTTKQMVYSSSVKQDLVISAYKPRESFVREFQQRAGDPEMAWAFVRQHLRNVPITADGNRDGKLDIIAERQDYLLFDRMVAWHIMNGIPVPMDAHTFYDGLRERFLERDGMYFLPDQVTEYDDKRAHMELDIQQMSYLVTDEKNAIAWLNYVLAQSPKTYQEIQPLYLQELHQSKQEKMPELLDMLRENFVQDEKGAWYIPDLTNAADLAKLRRKALLKEFYDSCVSGKGKLKVFRMEAIRAGFDECWKQRDFATIVSVGERLPESALQEDQTLLMYYDNACSRV